MSSYHLTEGSERPPLVEGKLRLYSMDYCMFAQRTRLVLLAKKIPHDIVNINLMKKLSWIFDIHPERKVPALDIGSKIIIESLDICDFLEGRYPDHPLYPAEEGAKQQEKGLIKKIGLVADIFGKIIFDTEKKSAAEWLKEFAPHIQVFEDELKKRGTLYFGGDEPKMTDYKLWPWAERQGSVNLILGERLPLTDNDYPVLRAWCKAMRSQPIVDSIYTGPKIFHRVLLLKKDGHSTNYDSL